MDTVENLLVPLIMLGVYILLAVAVGLSARKRGRRRWLWTLLTLVFNPLFMGLILAFLPDGAKMVEIAKEPPAQT